MFHLHIRYLSRDGGGSCDSVRQYIAREGRFAKRGDSVRWVQSLHMPRWADHDSAARYWQAAEGPNSRVNGRTAIVIEAALPTALAAADQNALALRMGGALALMATEDEIPVSRSPVTVALHEGYGRNPHAHILVSTSMGDGVPRDEKLWFRRFLPARPEAGGARRSAYMTKRRWVHRVRQTWARLANEALEAHGLPPTLDHRSNARRGLTAVPNIHLGPRIANMMADGVSTRRGARHREIAQQNEEELGLQASILRRRRAMQHLLWQDELLRHAERVWAAMRDRTWRSVFAAHPLAGNASELASRATAIVVETDIDNLQRVRDAFYAHRNSRQLAMAVGALWDPVTDADAFWAVRAGHDSVVKLGPGFAVTDGDDEESLATLIGLAQELPLRKPQLAVRVQLEPLARARLALIKVTWRVTTLGVRQRAPRRMP